MNISTNEIIFATTKQIAIEKLDEICAQIESSNDDNEFIRRRTKDLVITNRRKINALHASKACRGYKCSKAYVHWDISLRDLSEIIKPCLMVHGYKDGKFNIEMFGDM